MRSTKPCNQKRFLRIITIPIRVLSKARDFYVKSLNNFDGRAGYGMGYFSTASTLPKSFSVGSSRSADDTEDLRELARALSIRNNAGGGDVDLHMQQDQQQMRQSTAVMGSRKVPRSCSVAMGRIDEDKAYDFGEDNDVFYVKTEFVYPRSRSHAVNKRNLVF